MKGKKIWTFETTTKVVQSGGIGGGSAFTNGGATNTLTFDSPNGMVQVLHRLQIALSYLTLLMLWWLTGYCFTTGSSEPMYPAGTIKRGIGSYINGETNILTFTYLNSNEILLDVDMMNPASFPEVNYWLQGGGVASGFLLTPKQFMATIQPMRSKIRKI